MASLEELRSVRLAKLEELRTHGVRPFEVTSGRTHAIADVIDGFESMLAAGISITISGRIMAIRGQGAILFVLLWDGTDQFQAVFQKDEMNEDDFKLFGDTADIGDFIDCTGTLFTTKRGQDSIQTRSWLMLTKAIRPLPDKWSGLVDDDERQRHRYLELISDRAVFDRFVVRSKIVRYIRSYFDTLGFLEVETPILQSQAGGAMAKTFNTFHEDLQIPMVLRIALELEHKMLMAGGFPAIYEIGKNFRNEGSDPTHIQEFTMMEWYWAYHTLDDNIRVTENLLRGIIAELFDGKQEFTVYDKDGSSVSVHMGAAGSVWPRMRFDNALYEATGVEVSSAPVEVIRAKAIEMGMSESESLQTGRGNLLDFLFKKSVRSKIINPTFVTNYPGELKPLAQQNADGTAEVAQLIIAGAEITNQYAELIDPLVQRRLLEEQSAAKEGGDAEAMELDERFLRAMETGMPPMTGFGMGIDRLVAILTEQRNLRDTIFSPIMRPE
jgi:lysyl-tRNA synthetase, class II